MTTPVVGAFFVRTGSSGGSWLALETVTVAPEAEGGRGVAFVKYRVQWHASGTVERPDPGVGGGYTFHFVTGDGRERTERFDRFSQLLYAHRTIFSIPVAYPARTSSTD
jgi:hypothetical protein